MVSIAFFALSLSLSLLMSRIKHILASTQQYDYTHHQIKFGCHILKQSCEKGQHTIKVHFNGSTFTQQTHSLLSSSSLVFSWLLSSFAFSQFKQ